jgi:hypothetical protein
MAVEEVRYPRTHVHRGYRCFVSLARMRLLEVDGSRVSIALSADLHHPGILPPSSYLVILAFSSVLLFSVLGHLMAGQFF